MISGLHHIAILASEEERSREFYQALGFRQQRRYERPERNDVILMMEQNGVMLELFIAENHPERVSGPEAYGLRHLALRSENVCHIREILLNAGYFPEEIREDTFTGDKMFFVKDPDGLPVEVHE